MENINLKNEWDFIRKETFKKKYLNSPYPNWEVEIRELLLDAQNLLGKFEHEIDLEKKLNIGNKYKKIVGEYIFKLNSIN